MTRLEPLVAKRAGRKPSETASQPITNPQNAQDDRPLCRFFFLQGNCRFNEECAYSHSLPEGISSEEARSQIPCPYFPNCRYGAYCHLLHDPRELASADSCVAVSSSSAVSTADGYRSPPGGGFNTNDTCGICLESVTAVGHKFGLLSCCQHTFCFECLMEWRKEGSKEAEDRRACPTCRKKSDWVIPSSTLPKTEDDKERIATQYKTRLARIPCKNFETGELGSCPYGSDCFYAHLDRDGKDCKAQDRTMRQLYEQRQSQRNRRSLMENLEHEIDMIFDEFLMDIQGLSFGGVYYNDSEDDDDDYY